MKADRIKFSEIEPTSLLICKVLHSHFSINKLNESNYVLLDSEAWAQWVPLRDRQAGRYSPAQAGKGRHRWIHRNRQWQTQTNRHRQAHTGTHRQAGRHLIYPFSPMLDNLIHECPEISLYFLFCCLSELL